MNSIDNNKVPLCVDLDGTLLRSDMLIESVLALLKQNPLYVVQIPLWLFRGKACLKHEVASRVDLNQFEFAYNQDVVDYVSQEKHIRKTVLVTGSNQAIAEKVADESGLFDMVIGSNEKINLTSVRKQDRLVKEFEKGGFDYIGNDRDDLQVWPAAREALVVSSIDGIASKTDIQFSKVFDVSKPKLQDYLSLLRVHQWSKNVLVLVPLLLDQRLADYSAAAASVLAFVAMCVLASITYIINDALDLQADRQNTTKSNRALASGRISLLNGFSVCAILILVLIVLCLFLPPEFVLVLISYTLLTLLYSFYLKRIAILDVCIIAALHTIRVVGGSVVIAAAWSYWLFAFSMFVFFSFAFIKRVAELLKLKEKGKERALGRDYRVEDIPILMSAGVSAGYISVLIVALYINSEKVREMYTTPDILWLVCPILMYWIGRLWVKTARGEMHEDPIVFAMRDRVSVYVLGFAVLVVVSAKILPI